MKKLKPELVEERLANSFSLPKDIMMGLPDIRMIGNRECIIENYRGILVCTEECIQVQTKKQVIKITGQKLCMVYYTNDDMKISGFIECIVFQ